MKCQKNSGKKCLFWFVKRYMGVFCSRANHEYIVTCYQERKLEKSGENDAINEELMPYHYNGQEYHHTKYIKTMMSNFATKINAKYTNEYIHQLTELNELTSSLMAKGEEKVLNSQYEKTNIEDEIRKAGKNTASIRVLETEIKKIIGDCITELTTYNTNGNEAMNKAKRLLEEYNSYYNTELKFCLERIFIYWTSFYTAYKKAHSNNHNDLNIDQDVLMDIGKVSNPAQGFHVTEYIDVIDPYRDRNKMA